MTTVTIKQAELTALKLTRAHEVLADGHAEIFKAHGLSGPQYNVLRILRGARGEDLSCQEVGGRMLKRVPDVTRLLDRLEARDLIKRWRCEEDRRVVRLRKVIRSQFRHFDDKKLMQLDRLLDDLLHS